MAIADSTPHPQQHPFVLGGDSQRLSFLLRVGDLLAELVEGESAVDRLARACVPELADYAVVYVVDTQGALQLSSVSGEAGGEQLLRSLPRTPPESSAVTRALSTGQVQLVSDLDAKYLETLSAASAAVGRAVPLRSLLAVPISVRGQSLGVLGLLYGPSGRSYAPADVPLSEELGKRAGLSLLNARLLLREQEARRRLEILAAASGVAADAGLDPHPLSQRLTRLLADSFGDGCALRLLDQRGESLDLMALAHRDPEAERLCRELLLANPQRKDEGLAARVFATGAPAQLDLADDGEALSRALPWFQPYVRRHGATSVLYVPLRAHGRISGILALTRDRGGVPYGPEDREVVQQIADRAALALWSMRLYELELVARLQAERSAEYARRLQALATGLASALDHGQIGQIVVGEALAALGARAGVLAVLDGEAQELNLVASRGYPGETERRWARFSLEARVPLADSVRLGQPIFAGSLGEHEAAYGAGTGLRETGDQALLAAPLLFEGRAVGALGMTFSEPRSFSAEERTLVSAIAAQCAQAVERARLFGDEQRSRQRSRTIADAATILASSLDFKITLEQVARLLVPDLSDWCCVDLLDPSQGGPDTLRLVAAAHKDPLQESLLREVLLRHPPRPDDAGGTWAVLRSRMPMLHRTVPDSLLVASTRDDAHLRALRLLQIGSLIQVPIEARGRVLGVLTLVSARPGRYGALDLATAQELARHAAAAVDNARLFAEAEAAVAVRESFMSVAGHELRTPLTALKLQLQILDRLVRAPEADVSRIATAGGSALRQANRLDRLINELLDVSRIAAGRLAVDPQLFDLGELVQEVAQRHADDAVRADCEVRLTLLPGVRGLWDRARLDQVVSNLLGNAVKYGKGQPVELAVSMQQGVAELRVSDRGIGIAREHQQRIFKRYERAVSERHYGGLGLGLWIVSEIVAAHAGTVQLVSAPGEGSTFTVSLPAELPPRPAGQPPAGASERA